MIDSILITFSSLKFEIRISIGASSTCAFLTPYRTIKKVKDAWYPNGNHVTLSNKRIAKTFYERSKTLHILRKEYIVKPDYQRQTDSIFISLKKEDCKVNAIKCNS
ncbi:hypothetical protein VIGAN_01197700 [Vigna angularis var. angularis]|uniref:Uncharacterized protein n=1 Tax=Vigna angularis var. angularis TaxID=157739 RepID=A0A0S3R100_PHAAN|nr:hypothetical protein VIGAN_01197700 [Vigna angularis var. angularis]